MSLNNLLISDTNKKNLDIYVNDLNVSGTTTKTGTENITGQLNVDNLRLDGNEISSTDTNGNISLNPDGTGQLTMNGAVANWGANTGDHLHLYDNGVDVYSIGVDANIMNLKQPAGSTYQVQIGGANEVTMNSNGINVATGNDYRVNNDVVLNATTLGTNVINSSLQNVGTLSEVQVDNVNINSNTVSTTDVNGDLIIAPNGTGEVLLSGGNVISWGANTGDMVKLFDDGASVYSIGTGVSKMVSKIPNGSVYENQINSSVVMSMAATTLAFAPSLQSTPTGTGDVACYYNATDGRIGVQSSSRRYKEQIEKLDQKYDTLDLLDKINPVTFRYKSNPEVKYVGFIAEDFEDNNVEEICYYMDNKLETVNYDKITALLWDQNKKMKAQFDELKADYEAYKLAHP